MGHAQFHRESLLSGANGILTWAKGIREGWLHDHEQMCYVMDSSLLFLGLLVVFPYLSLFFFILFCLNRHPSACEGV